MKTRDPRFNPFNAPTRAGLHPNSGRISIKDPLDQNGYEVEEGATAKIPVDDPKRIIPNRTLEVKPEHHGKPKGVVDWMFEHPFLSLIGLAAVGVAADSLLREPRKNPADPPEVTVSPVGAPATAALPQICINFGTGAVPSVTTTSGVSIPAAPVTASPPPAPIKKPRVRLTTQARDNKGKFLPAGTAPEHKEGVES